MRYDIIRKMLDLDTALADNKYHSQWYSVNDIERLMSYSKSQVRYYLESMHKAGKLEKRKANKGHGYYWWYEYRVIDALREAAETW